MKRLKWIGVILLTLCLCVLPVHAETVDVVEKLLSPMDDAYETANMVCPQILPRNEQGFFSVYMEFYHLTEDFWLEVKLGKQTIVSTTLVSEEEIGAAWVNIEGPARMETLEIFILDQQGGRVVYQSAVRLELSDQLAFDLQDAIACTPAINVSVASRTAMVTACLPLHTETDDALYGQIVDQDGMLYGTSHEPVKIGNLTMPDSRFDEIFKENPYEVLLQSLSAEITFSKLPEPGSYDLVFVNVKGEEQYRFEGVVQCDDEAVAQVVGWTAVPGDKEEDAEVTLFLVNGAPADFTLELYQGENLLGKSADCYVLEHDRVSGGIYLTYPFFLETALNGGQIYTAKIVTSHSYHGESSCSLEAVRTETGTIYGSISGFDSAYFANILLKTTGFAPEKQYKAVLEQSGKELAECLVTCDEQGWFDIAFVDENEKPFAIASDASYSVLLYRWENGGQWRLVDETALQAIAEKETAVESSRFYVQAGGLPVKEIVVNDHLVLTNGKSEDLRLQLFGQQDQNNQPAFTENVSYKQEYTIADKGATLFSAQRYRAVSWCGDRVVGVDPSGYWVDVRCMQDFQVIPVFEIELVEAVHGTVQLFSDNGTPVNQQDWLGFTEIYVHAVPDAGYVVNGILVNGKQITGRSFLLAENTEVTVRFQPRQVETFPVILQHSAESDKSGGGVHCVLERAALGDLVTLLAQPKEGFLLREMRVIETKTGLEVPLQVGKEPNTWQFTMPEAPVTIEVTFRAKVHAEIDVSYNEAVGTVDAPAFAWEGDMVTVTAKPYEGCTLEALWLVYDLAGVEQRENLLEHPGSTPDSYCFCVPGAEKVWVYPTFKEHRFAISLPEPLPLGGKILVSQENARPGSTITVTVIPDDNYRLTEGSLSVCTEVQETILLTPSDKPLTWTFIMPWTDVQVSAAFEGTEPEITGVTVEVQGADSLTIRVQIRNATAGVSLATALYDGQGRLLGVELQACADGMSVQSLPVSYRGKPAAGSLFFLETGSFMPLNDVIPLTLPQ